MQDHLTQTQSQADRVEARLTALGGKPNDGKGVLNTILGKGSDLLNVFHDKEDKQTQDVIKAYALENFEVGMYTSFHAYADAVGDAETAALVKTIIGEEQQAAEKMLALIPQVAVQAVGRPPAWPERSPFGARRRAGTFSSRPASLCLGGWFGYTLPNPNRPRKEPEFLKPFRLTRLVLALTPLCLAAVPQCAPAQDPRRSADAPARRRPPPPRRKTKSSWLSTPSSIRTSRRCGTTAQ